MNQRLVKKNASGQVVAPGSDSAFSSNEIKDRSYIEKRNLWRENAQWKGRRGSVRGRRPPEAHDQFEDLVDPTDSKGRKITWVRTLQEMETKKLTSAELKGDLLPWSDDYWPIYKGILGARYADESFADHSEWDGFNQYILKNPVEEVLKLGEEAVNNLSPSEKYDLLVGDSSGAFTQSMWEEGKKYWERYKKVERWMGICHGWAPASYMLSRPQKAITLEAFTASDLKIKFYPSDIKGLLSQLWAKARVSSRFIGGRCDVKSPKTDEESGAVINAECFDNNPATWHLSVVNQIGLAQRSFVIDATYDYEVWNQPVVSYSYTYFNPLKNKEVETLEEAIVPYSKMSEKDKFAKLRTKRKFTHVVGVAMDVTYVVETSPSHRATDSSRNDAHRTVRYVYDLELNAASDDGESAEIVGGEWYTNLHPDFLWTPERDVRALAVLEEEFFEALVRSAGREAAEWKDSELKLPKAWQDLVKKNSRYGMPVARVLEELVQRAQK